MLTGESRPIPKRTGDKVTGGAVNMSSSLLVRVTQVGQDTLLSGIVRLLDRALAEKPQLTKIADQIAAWFVLVVLVLAAVTFVAWQWYNPDQALWVGRRRFGGDLSLCVEFGDSSGFNRCNGLFNPSGAIGNPWPCFRDVGACQSCDF